MQRGTKDDQGYRSYITGAFDHWARLYDPFLALFRLKGVRRQTVEISGVGPKDREDRVRFLQMHATKLDFADKEFDVSSISFGLHDVPPEVREEALREIGWVTRGKIVIVDYNPPPSRLLRALYIAVVSLWESKYVLDFARSDLEGLLAGCGLKVERERAAWLGFVRTCLDHPRE